MPRPMPLRHNLRVACSAVVLAASVAACSSAATTPTASAPSAATAPAGPNDVGADLPTPLTYPTEDATSRTAAEQAAADTMAAFVRVDLDADAWLADLSPHLTPAAEADYVGTDPLQVPARQVTGPALWDGSTSSYLAGVVVPTDVGDYRLLLVREGQNSPWLVQTISPPDGLA